MMDDPINIAGVLVRSVPQRRAEVAAQMRLLANVEVHQVLENGNIVVTIEEPAGDQVLVKTMGQLSDVSGVLATSLIYSHSDDGLMTRQEENDDTDKA